MQISTTPEELIEMGAKHFAAGDFHRGESSYREAAAIYSRESSFKMLGFTLATLALRLGDKPEGTDEAIEAYREAAEAFLKAGVPKQAADVLFTAGIFAKQKMRSQLAVQLLHDSAERYQQLSLDSSRDDSEELNTLAAECRKQASTYRNERGENG